MTEISKRVQAAIDRHGLGRMQAPDPRDKRYMLAHLLVEAPPPVETRYWSAGAVLNQGAFPRCVAYAWTGFLLAAPIKTKLVTLGGPQFPITLYSEAQERDEWPGESYDGTSVRGGCKALVDRKRISEYRWAFDAETARKWVLTRGPLVFGTDWHEQMFVPDQHGFIRATGDVVGGHAYLAIGFSKTRWAFRILNSWSRSWGFNGRAWLGFDDGDRLIQAQGEACSAVEITPAAP